MMAGACASAAAEEPLLQGSAEAGPLACTPWQPSGRPSPRMLALLLSASALAAVALVAVLPSAHAPRGPPDPAGALTAAMPAAPPCTAGSSGTQQLRLCVAPDSQPTAEPPGPPAVTKQAPEAMLEGRWWPGATANSSSGRLPQIATWGASAATVAFADATALTITINGSMDRPGLYDVMEDGGDTYLNKQWWKGPLHPSCRFRFDLDGRPLRIAATTRCAPLLQARLECLPPGPHILTITKISEAGFGAAALESIALDGPATARFLPPPRPPRRRVMVVGDSFSAGVWAATPPDCTEVERQNTSLGYAAVASAALGASLQNLAVSSSGAVWCTTGGDPWVDAACNYATAIPSLWRRWHALDSRPTYRQAAWQPHVVLLAGGINDIPTIWMDGGYSARLQRWLGNYTTLVQQMQQQYPGATFVQLVWPYEALWPGIYRNPDGSPRPELAVIYQLTLERAFAALQEAGVRRLHLLRLEGQGMDPQAWCGAHPNASTNALVAQQVVAYVRGLRPSPFPDP